MSDTPPLGFASGWTRPPPHPRPASHPLRSTGGESEQKAFALARRRRDRTRHAKLNLGSAGGGHEGPAGATLLGGRRCGSHLRGWAPALLPGSHTRDVICKAAPFAASQREPSANGSPPAPRAKRDRRPGSLKITSSCAATGCGAVTRTAYRRPRRPAAPHPVAVRAPACRHPARQPTAAAVAKIWRGKTPNPRPSPDARPLPSPRGLRRNCRANTMTRT